MGTNFFKIDENRTKMKLSMLLMVGIGAIPAKKGTNLTPGAFDELIKMLTDLKSEIVASKTEDTADAFDQSFGDDFSDEPNASPFDVFAEMEKAETEEIKADPFFDSADAPIFDESIFDGPDRIKMPIYDETELTEETNLEKNLNTVS